MENGERLLGKWSLMWRNFVLQRQLLIGARIKQISPNLKQILAERPDVAE